jgi:uncharacterized small protein (DUF1192 family)
MIDRADELPRFVQAPPEPQHMAFTANGEEVGRMFFENPLRFEGDAEASAKVFFEHVVKFNNIHIAELDERIMDLEEELVRLAAKLRR